MQRYPSPETSTVAIYLVLTLLLQSAQPSSTPESTIVKDLAKIELKPARWSAARTNCSPYPLTAALSVPTHDDRKD
ncbi:hypothetical protein V8C35DRAFT_299121 [Trichoderma chlorosporum]